MGLLFNREIQEIDVVEIGSQLSQSGLDNIEVETAIVEIMEEMIAKAEAHIGDAEMAMLKIENFTGDNLSVNRQHIKISSDLSIEVPLITIEKNAGLNISGVVSTSNASGLYTDTFWREGNNVYISNRALSTAGMIHSLDVMMTRELRDKVFLGRGPEQELVGCSAIGIDGPVNLTNVDPLRVINMNDAARTYVKIGDKIDLNQKTLNTDSLEIMSTEIDGSADVVSCKRISFLEATSGIETIKRVREAFLGQDLMLSDDAITPKKDSNIVSIENLSTVMSENHAPSNGWRIDDATREGSLSEETILAIKDGIIQNDFIEEGKVGITKVEATTVLDAVIERITSIGACD